MGNRILIVHGPDGLSSRISKIAALLEDAGHDVSIEPAGSEIVGAAPDLIIADELPPIYEPAPVIIHYAHVEPEPEFVYERHRHPKHQTHPKRYRK